MIRPKYLILALVRARFWGETILGCFSPFIQGSIWLKEKKGKEKKKEERRREVQEIQVWNISFLYGTLVWNSCLKILV